MDNFILLPTDQGAALFQSIKYPELLQVGDNTVDNPYWQGQHLYQISTDLIEMNDWYYDPEVDFPIRKVTKTGNNGYEGCRKIVATTDPDLLVDNLPIIPKEVVDKFIREYNHIPA